MKRAIMSAALKEIIEEVHALPPDDQDRVREAINMLASVMVVSGLWTILSKANHLEPGELRELRDALIRGSYSLLTSTLTPEQRQRAALIRRVRGKYADLATSSDDYAREKAEEIAREDRRSLS